MKSCDEFYLYDNSAQMMLGVSDDNAIVPVADNATKFILTPATGCPEGAAELSTTVFYTLTTPTSTVCVVVDDVETLSSDSSSMQCAVKLKATTNPDATYIPVLVQIGYIPTETKPDVPLTFSTSTSTSTITLYIGLCAAEYAGTASQTTTFSFHSTPTGDTSSPTPTRKLETGALVGIVVGSIVIVLLFLIFLFFFKDKKRREKASSVNSATRAPPPPHPAGQVAVK